MRTRNINSQKLFTPENLDVKNFNKEFEIFVFGSNKNGNHAGGAAKLAKEYLGAIDGINEGIQGNSYAIPTLDCHMRRLSLDEISKSIDIFYKFALDNQHLEFWMTKIGCGIAGFDINEMSNIFKSKTFQPLNVYLPIEFSR